MIQDIAPHHLDNAYLPVPPDKDSIALCFEGRACLMNKAGEEIVFPRFSDLEKDGNGIYSNYTYLFKIDEERYYLARKEHQECPAGFRMEGIEIFRAAEPQYRAFAGITGYQLYNWYQKHRYCGQCGSVTRLDSKERMLFCEKCGSMEY